MLIYVSCKTPEQSTDYLYFKLKSFFLHGSIYFLIVVLCRA